MSKDSATYREKVAERAAELAIEMTKGVCGNKDSNGECLQKDLCGHVEILALLGGNATKIQQQDAGLMLWYTIRQELAREEAAKLLLEMFEGARLAQQPAHAGPAGEGH